MSFSAYKKKKPYYVLLPNENLIHYVYRLIKDIIKMYPYARKHGLRYYIDTDYRRGISYRRRTRHKENVRNKRMGPLRKPHYKAIIKLLLFERSKQLCNHCKKPFCINELTIDHILPLFLGGDSNINNLQLLCEPCHRVKTKQEHLDWQKTQAAIRSSLPK